MFYYVNITYCSKQDLENYFSEINRFHGDDDSRNEEKVLNKHSKGETFKVEFERSRSSSNVEKELTSSIHGMRRMFTDGVTPIKITLTSKQYSSNLQYFHHPISSRDQKNKGSHSTIVSHRKISFIGFLKVNVLFYLISRTKS